MPTLVLSGHANLATPCTLGSYGKAPICVRRRRPGRIYHTCPRRSSQILIQADVTSQEASVTAVAVCQRAPMPYSLPLSRLCHVRGPLLLAFLAAMICTQPAVAQFRESFESTIPSW